LYETWPSSRASHLDTRSRPETHYSCGDLRNRQLAIRYRLNTLCVFLPYYLCTVARNVSKHATATQCKARWEKSLDPNLKHGAWTEQEDDQLRKAVAGYGTSWIQVAAAVPGRTNDQCRERWLEHLNATTQVSWTGEDDKILLDSVNELGNKWKEISKKIGNKTGPSVGSQSDFALCLPESLLVSSAVRKVEKSIEQAGFDGKTFCNRI